MSYSEMRFTELYLNYVKDITDAPDAYSRWLAYLVLSSVVNKNVHMSFGIERLYPNLWFLIIGPSSTYRKSYSQKIAATLVRKIFPEFVLFDTSSRESFFAELGRDDRDAPFGCGLITIDEFSGFMKRTKESKHFSGFIQDLSSLFDGQYNPRRTGVSEKEKTILKIDEPFLNLTAACSFDWLNKAVEKADLSGGFLARFIWVVVREKLGDIWAEPGEADPEKRSELINQLNQYRGMVGQMTWAHDAHALWKHWYNDFRKRNSGGPWDANYERITLQTKKIAMLNAVQDSSFVVSYQNLDEAINMTEPLVDSLGEIVMGDNFHELTKNKILSFIKKAEPHGISRTELLNNIAGINKKILDEHEATLLEAERISVSHETSGGRKRTVYRLKNPIEIVKATLNV